MPSFVRVAAVADVPVGKTRLVMVADKMIALCNVGGTFYALDNFCLHRGGPLSEGHLDGEKIECPWHGWQFNVRTGGVVVSPDMKVDTYEVKVEGDDVLIAV